MRTVYAIVFSLITLTCFSQEDQTSRWQNIELSLRTKNSLNATGNQLEQLKQAAINNKDAASLARAYCYLMLLKDQKTEDSLYFRNSAFIDSILLSRSDTTLKAMMHYLQAQRLWKFNKMSLKFNRATYETKDLPVNYAVLDRKQLDSLINFHFEQAAAIAAYLQQTGQEPPLEKIAWLSTTPAAFLYIPSLTDIIYSEQISYNRIEEAYLPHSYKVGAWLSLSSHAFIDSVQALIGRQVYKDRVLSRYCKWIEQTASRKNVQSSIEFSLRKYLYQDVGNENDSALQKVWEACLNECSHAEYPETKAEAIFNLCSLYLQWAEKYPAQLDVYNRQPIKPFDQAYQFYNVKAIQLYESNKGLFERYGSLKAPLDELYQLRNPFVQVNMSSENVPVKPILTRLEYRNTPQFFYRIVRMGIDETFDEKKAGAQFSGRPVYRAQTVALPLPEDYNLHRTFLKIDPLPPGHYCLLFSYDADFVPTLVNYQPFYVTGLAVVKSNDRVYVLDRATGMPVAGAKVIASYTESKDTLDHVHTYTTNAKGALVLTKEEDYTLLVSYKGDTLEERANVVERETPEEVFTKEEYDDLADYYDDNITTEIFTDRAIYRPGQTVFFKAVFITKDPKTGEACLLNEANLKHGLNNWLKKWIEENDPELRLQDPFGRKVDSLLIHPDSYGAVSGSFTLPRNAPTGSWNIDAGYLDEGTNRGDFEVEEYKRPTFELSVSPPVKTYRMGDTLCFVLKLQSFSGSTMNNIPVQYSIERIGIGEIIDTIAYTDAQGRLVIQFTDTSITETDKHEDLSYTYELEASATDVTGESHDVSSRLQVATRPVKIRIPVYGTINKNDLRPLLFNTKDVNGLEINATLQARLYRIVNRNNKDNRDYSGYADQWLYDRNELAGLFKEVQFYSSPKEREELIYESTINTAKKDKFRWPVDLLTNGNYRLEVTAMEDSFTTGTATRTLTVFEPGTQLPAGDHFLFQLPANYLKRGDTLTLFSGSDRDSSYRIIQLKYYSLKGGKKILHNRFIESMETKGIRKWTWKLPAGITDRLLISEVYVAGNNVYHRWENVSIATDGLKPNIVVEKFRSTLTPGAPTTYAVSIKTNDQATAAQLMTVIYDASLDKLAEHRWQIPGDERSRSLSSDWTSMISYEVSSHSPFKEIPEKLILQLMGRMPGVMVTNATGLDDVVVVGYGVGSKNLEAASMSTINIRGLNSIRLEDYKLPLVILDGVPYTGELSSLNVKEITEMMVLKDADATALYGARAAGGVLLISTKGEIKLPVVKKEPVLKVRSNFNETAFFAPAIYANKEGLYTFTFTTPESLTEWNWKLMAHTKELQFVYAERKLVTQLPLMMQPQLPTHLYQGDKIIIKSRIANLDTLRVTGKAQCKIEDAVTGSDLTALLVAKPEVAFETGAQSNTVAAFELKVPGTLLHPIKISLTAKTGEYADGEEHELPILSRKILVKQNQAIVLKEREMTISRPATNNLYGVELSVPEKPQAALLYSLPFLANYSYNCAEQLFNRMYAHVIALQLMRKDTVLRKLYHNALPHAGNTPGERPVTALAQETMPWLTAGNRAAKDQEALLKVLDTLNAKVKIRDYLEKIWKCQNSDGGLSWFPGGKSNAAISFYLLARFGALYKMGEPQLFTEMEIPIKNLIHYCNNKLFEEKDPKNLPRVYYYYALGFWKQRYSLDSAQALQRSSHFREYWKETANLSLQEQALLCLTTMQYFQDSLHQKAVTALQNIKERAIVDTINGTRWKELAESEDIGAGSEETIANLLEAFKEAGNGEHIEPGVVQWLLTSKQQHQWRTTTGTAAIISVLLQQKGSTTGATNSVKALLPDTTLKVADGLLDGSRTAFHESGSLSSLVIQKATDTPVNVNLGWYYFAEPDSVAGLSSGVHIQKTIARYNEKANSWERIGETNVLKLGEKVRVTITIETPKPLRYVFINDQKAAAFEPAVYQSGYNWGGDFTYYESIRDAGRQFFADLIPSGRTHIEYEMTVAHEGSFVSGLTSLECMYRPEIAAYGNVQKIVAGN